MIAKNMTSSAARSALAASFALVAGMATVATIQPAIANGFVSTQCVVFLQDGGEIAVVNARTFEACHSAGVKCAQQDLGKAWTDISFFTNWTAVESTPSNYVCQYAF